MCDDFDVKSLPYDFVPNDRPSEAIKRLMEKRKTAHYEAIEKMKADLRQVNGEMDTVIEEKSKEIQSSIEEIRAKVDEDLYGLKSLQENQFNLEEHTFTNAKIEIENIKSILRDLIDKYMAFLIECQNDRRQKIKAILKKTYANLENVGYESPFKIANYIETELLDINKMSLNNHQNIGEVEKQLRLQVEHYVKEWDEQILEIKELLKKYLKALTKLSMVKMRSTIQTATESEKSTELKEQISRIVLLQSELKLYSSLETLMPVTREQVDKWLKEVQRILAGLDESAKNLVNSYKSIITILFNRFFDELQGLKKTIIATGIVEKKELEDFQGEIYTPAAEELNLRFTEDLTKLQRVWGTAIEDMKVGVMETYQFLKKAAGLWDRHFIRLKEAQILVESDIENMVAKNSHAALINEIKVNILLDKLRQCPVEKKLDKLLDEVKLSLAQVEKFYAGHFASEIQVACKYHSLIETEVEILMAEIRRYLSLYPRDDERDPKKQRKRASQDSCKEVDPNEQLIPIQLIYCMFQVDAVKNWKFGLWEAINNYLDTGRAEILTLADEWINKQKEKIQERFDVKLAIHRPRFQRVVCSIYNKRIHELELHSSRYFEHKKAVDIELKKLNGIIENSREQCNVIITDFENTSELFFQRISGFKKSSQVLGQVNIFHSLESKKLTSIIDIIEASKAEAEELLNKLETSNYLFLKAIRFFSEMGNFTVEEAFDLQKNIKKLEEIIQKDFQNFYENLQQDCTKFTAHLENIHTESISSANHAIKELEFNESTVKHVVECQISLRKEVIDLKTKIKVFENSIKNLMNKSNENLDKDDFITYFNDEVTNIADEAQEIITKLEYRKPIEISISVQQKHSKRKSVASVKSFSNVESSNIRKSNPSALFLTNNFLGNMNGLITLSFNRIRLRAKEFYAKHTQFFMSEEVIHHTNELFMQEVLRNYEKIINSCCIVWLDNSNVLLSMLDNFNKYIKSYVRHYESNFCKKSSEVYKKAFEDVMQELVIKKTETQEDIKSMYKKLKALHGHPRNKQLLNELETQSNQLAERYKNRFADLFPPYKNKLISTNEILTKRYKKIKPTIDALIRNEELHQVIEKAKYETIMKVDTNDPEVMASRVTLDEDASRSKSEQQVVLLQHSSSSSAESGQTFITSEESMVSSSSANESLENFDDFVREMDIDLEINVRKISDFIQGQLVASIDNFNEIWANEIKNVISLYKLRYN